MRELRRSPYGYELHIDVLRPGVGREQVWMRGGPTGRRRAPGAERGRGGGGRQGMTLGAEAPLARAHAALEADLAVLDRLADADARMRRASNKQLHFEIALIRAAQSLDEVRISDVVKALEKGSPPDPERDQASPEKPANPSSREKASSNKESQAAPSAMPRRTPHSGKRTDVEGQLASLIEQAPDSRPDTPPAPEAPASPAEAPPRSETTPSATASSTREPTPSPSSGNDGFYDDPLVHDALRIFKGKLKE